ncbi:MAG: hypothetical protein IPH57_18140, partial [Saprospiraceae bacterium]|nr:hypothetical protein [Saprospiraceae bacterium]
RSAGIELLFDNVYFRQFEIPFGIGFDYTPDVADDKNPFNIRLLLGF